MSWYYANEDTDEQDGPFDVPEMYDLVRGGYISYDTLVWSEDLGDDWLPLRDCTYLLQQLTPQGTGLTMEEYHAQQQELQLERLRQQQEYDEQIFQQQQYEDKQRMEKALQRQAFEKMELEQQLMHQRQELERLKQVASTPQPPPPAQPKPQPHAPAVRASMAPLSPQQLPSAVLTSAESALNMGQFDLEDTLTDTNDLNVGKTVYVTDGGDGWLQAVILSHSKGTYVIELIESGEKVNIKPDVGRLFLTNEHILPDICSLPNIHEPGVLANIGERYVMGEYYSSLGVLLVAVNPLKKIREPDFDLYASKQEDITSAPHPYGTAQLSYDLMCFSNCSQCVVLSGESGSGKTEVVKMLMSYLVRRSFADDAEDAENSFDQRLLKSSTIMESFGHARAGRNNNSSRFSRFIKLYYEDAVLSSAMIETFFLEKGRVLRAGEGERSFHIFYQLLASVNTRGGLAASFPHLNLTKADDYMFLNQSGCTTYPGANDDVNFRALVDAMTTVGFTFEQAQGFMQIVAAILHLGNISFEDERLSSGGYGCRVVNTDEIEMAAEALMVDVYDLHAMLTEKIAPTGESIRFTSMDAAFARDWVAKTLYEGLFLSINYYINLSLACGKTTHRKIDAGEDPGCFIGLVDMCGFCSLELNEFEQFLINYANEYLQHTFNTQVFEAEMRLYESQNVEVALSNKPDNSACLEMLADRQRGIFAVLDLTCLKPQSTDELFLDTINKSSSISQSKYYPPPPAIEKANAFCVRHYAGTIKYSTFPSFVEEHMGILGNSWVAKNNDLTPLGLTELCARSTLPEVVALPLSNESGGGSKTGLLGARNLSTTRFQKKPTVASTVTHAMTNLNNLLNFTSCQYIRCIKPNHSMSPDVFDNAAVIRQMRGMAIVETAQVYRVGFPVRIPFAAVKEALGDITPELSLHFRGKQDRLFVSCIMRAFDIPHEAYKLGETMIFFKTRYLHYLDQLLGGPPSSQAECAKLVSEIESALVLSRKAYSISERMDEEIDDLDGAVKHVRHAFSLLEHKFERISKSPLALPGRVKAVSDLLGKQKYVLTKIDQMYAQCDKFSAQARDGADHCRLEYVEERGEMCDRMLDMVISQVHALIKSTENSSVILDSIENDAKDIEWVAEQAKAKAKVELAFKTEQLNNMSEALMFAEVEQRKQAEKRVQTEILARQALEQKLREIELGQIAFAEKQKEEEREAAEAAARRLAELEEARRLEEAKAVTEAERQKAHEATIREMEYARALEEANMRAFHEANLRAKAEEEARVAQETLNHRREEDERKAKLEQYTQQRVRASMLIGPDWEAKMRAANVQFEFGTDAYEALKAATEASQSAPTSQPLSAAAMSAILSPSTSATQLQQLQLQQGMHAGQQLPLQAAPIDGTAAAGGQPERKPVAVMQAERRALEMEKRALEAEKRSVSEARKASELEKRMLEAAEEKKKSDHLSQLERRAKDAELRALQAEELLKSGAVESHSPQLSKKSDKSPSRLRVEGLDAPASSTPPPVPPRATSSTVSPGTRRSSVKLSVKDLLAAKNPTAPAASPLPVAPQQNVKFPGNLPSRRSSTKVVSRGPPPMPVVTDEEAKECVDAMITWMKANCTNIRARDSEKYASIFYENKMKSMARVARRFTDDAELWSKLEIDQYDGEELLEALKRNNMMQGPSALLSGGGALATLAPHVLEDESKGEGVQSFANPVALAKGTAALAPDSTTSIAGSAPPPITAVAESEENQTLKNELAMLKEQLAALSTTRDSKVAEGNGAVVEQKEEGGDNKPVAEEKKKKDKTSRTKEVPAEDAPLPEGWEAKVDKSTQKTYYVNKATKERSWKRPVATGGGDEQGEGEEKEKKEKKKEKKDKDKEAGGEAKESRRSSTKAKA